MTAYYFVEPLDVLMIRGNKSFGGAGEHGEAVMPPWPSLFAGAFRSALLGTDAHQLARFSAGERLPDALGQALGTPAEPGEFRVTWLSLAKVVERRITPQAVNSTYTIEAATPLPADLAAFDDANVAPLVRMSPSPWPAGVRTGATLPLTALLKVRKQIKPHAGRWLAGEHLAAHVAGKTPQATATTGDFYRRETRLGIALDAGSRTAADGALYTTEAVSFCPHAGFLVGISGDHGLVPKEGLLRLGGDGKGARYRRVDFTPPQAPLIPQGGRFRFILATPGIFAGGWLPDGINYQPDGSYRLRGSGFSARLACAAVARHEVVSGWDLARWAPKIAQRVVPAGSVYWFDELDGDPGKLATWVSGGLWGENPDPQRRTEGFNRAWLAAWPQSN